MTTRTLERKTSQLKKEIGLLRSFVIGQAGKDPEGSYNPDFVKRVMGALSEEPKYEFKNTHSFLRHIRGVR